jgi:hypothetical protein
MKRIKKELWVDSLVMSREGSYYKNSKILNDMKNLNYAVENDRINWAFRGADAQVIMNATYPLPVARQTGFPDYTELDKFPTEAIPARNIEELELSYDERRDFLDGTRQNLVAAIERDCMWSLGPTSNSVDAPIYNTPSSNPLGTDGYQLVTADDLMALRIMLDNQYPAHMEDEWVLVLDSDSYRDMRTQLALNQQTGVCYCGFEIYEDNRTPFYKTDGTKLPNGSTPIIGMDLPSCIAYVKQKSGFFATGTTKMSPNLDNPIEQGSIWSFLTRAKAGMFGAIKGQEALTAAILRTR